MELKISYEEYKKLIRDTMHESRNYLGLVSAYITLLERLYPDVKAKEYIKVIIESNKKSLELTENLMNSLLDKVKE